MKKDLLKVPIGTLYMQQKILRHAATNPVVGKSTFACFQKR